MKQSIAARDTLHDILSDSTVAIDDPDGLQPLVDSISDERIVMLGEASHGTHEYYVWRSHLTKKLIEEKGFNIIAVEGDWPDCYQVNRYIKKEHEAQNIADVLKTFVRWPTWMWGNWETAALAEWLRGYNDTRAKSEHVSFFGLDVYSLWQSLDAILEYLSRVDKHAYETAKKATLCFEPYREDEGQSYARASRIVPELCEKEVIDLLKEIQNKMPQYDSGRDNVFSTEQNALIAVNAEKYYREMIHGGPASWNIRDMHMQETIERLLGFYGRNSKIIVWAHNTHIGDASATEMANEGMYNIGELSRSNPLYKTFLIGFGSYKGTVMAGREWGAPMQVIPLPPAIEISWETAMHDTGKGNQLLLMDKVKHTSLSLEPIGHRAVGVVYRPRWERYGNYVQSVMAKRYDAFVFIDESKALHPVPLHADDHKMPETYPFGV
jgi:erythromycin esterase